MRFIRKARKVVYFLGRRTVVWLSLGTMAAAATAASELGMSFLIQALLVTLNLVSPEVYGTKFEIISVISNPNFLMVGFLIVIGTKATCQFVSLQAAAVSQEALNARLRRIAIFDLLHRKNFVSAAEMNSRIGDTFPKASLFALYSSSGLPSLIQCGVLLGCMFWLAWFEALFSLVSIVVIASLVWMTNRKVSRIASTIPREQRSIVQGIERVARNWLLVRILRTSDQESRRLNKSIENYSARFIRSKLLASAASSIPILLGGVMLVSVIALHRYFDTSGTVLVAFIYLLVRLTQQLASFAKFLGMASSYFPHFKMSAKYFFEFKTGEIQEALHPKWKASGEASLAALDRNKTRKPAPRIELINLGFRYGHNHDWVFRNLHLVIPAKTQFGIVGRSGAGKSTLLALVLGVLEPTEGAILIDGQSPADYFSTPGVGVGYVGAEPFLIEGSIEQNLKYGSRQEHFPDDCWRALSEARIDTVVRSKPDQLNFMLKENGEGLSAGQKQRLALARAMLEHPQILVLDEASANLDKLTEAEIAESIADSSRDWTVLVVSHRERILRSCQTIHHLDQTLRNNPVIQSADVSHAEIVV